MEISGKGCSFLRHWVISLTSSRVQVDHSGPWPAWPSDVPLCHWVSTYRLQLPSTKNARTPVFLNWQRALSQLLSLIRSFAGQAVFSPRLILQTALCDTSCRMDSYVSLLPLCFAPLAYSPPRTLLSLMAPFPIHPSAHRASVAHTIPGAMWGSVWVPPGHCLAVTMSFHSQALLPLCQLLLEQANIAVSYIWPLV